MNTREILESFGLKVFEPEEGLFASLFDLTPQQAEDVLSRALSLAEDPEYQNEQFSWDAKGKFRTLPVALKNFFITETGSFEVVRNRNQNIDGLIYSEGGKSVKCLSRFADLWKNGTLLEVSEDSEGFLKLLISLP